MCPLFHPDLRTPKPFAIMLGGEGQTMPLHDWKDERGWDGVHLLWLAQLLDWIQPRLPPGFRAYVGSVPALTLEAGNGKPDVTLRGWRSPPSDPAPSSSA